VGRRWSGMGAHAGGGGGSGLRGRGRRREESAASPVAWWMGQPHAVPAERTCYMSLQHTHSVVLVEY
jgi:hypothetical protein